MSGRLFLLALLAAACLASGVAAPAAFAAPPGALTQLPGESGCIHDDDTGVLAADLGCDQGKALVGAESVTVSPDGENVYVAANGVAVFSRDQGSGVLTQLPGTAGCVSDDGNGGDCTDGAALVNPISVAISPDGKSAYVASANSDAVAVFSRDQTTGALTQVDSEQRCISDNGSGGACGDGRALDGAKSVAVSPDGKTVYVVSEGSEAVAVFARNEIDGTLSQLSDVNGCIRAAAGEGCSVVPLLDGAQSIAAAPDGTSAYVASRGTSDAVLHFARNQANTPSQGALTFTSCVSETGSSMVCADGRGLGGAQSVTVTPDGDGVYLASLTSDAVAAFSRDGTTGTLAQPPGQAGCVSDTGSGGECADGKALNGALFVAADEKNVYAAAPGSGSDGVAAFSRDPGTSGLAQLPGIAACVSQTGSAGACEDGRALDDPSGLAVSPDGKNAYTTAESVSGGLAIFAREQDSDSDGAGESDDNCPGVSNSNQQDTDGDGLGDVCDASPGGTASTGGGGGLLPGACANLAMGTGGRDTLSGTPAGDRLRGLRGNDALRGGDGDDCLEGGAGSDRLSGQAGNDTLTGGPGRDRLTGGPGKNRYSAGSGKDRVSAANRTRETVNCGTGRDSATVDRRDRVRGCERVRRKR